MSVFRRQNEKGVVQCFCKKKIEFPFINDKDFIEFRTIESESVIFHHSFSPNLYVP